MEAALWGFLGALVGAGASIATSWLNNHHELKRQQQANSLERIERARSFQRDNLLALQQTLQDGMRFLGRAHLEDERAFQQSGEWGKAMLPEDIAEGTREINAKLASLIQRVADDALRASIKSLHSQMTSCLSAGSREQALTALDNTSNSYNGLMEQLGQVLRALY